MDRNAGIKNANQYLLTYQDVHGYEPIYETNYNINFVFIEEEEQQQAPPPGGDDGVGASIH